MSRPLCLRFFLSRSFKKTKTFSLFHDFQPYSPPSTKYKQISHQPWPAPFRTEILHLTQLQHTWMALFTHSLDSNNLKLAHRGADHQRWCFSSVFGYHPPQWKDSQQRADKAGEDVNLLSSPEMLPPAGCFGTKPLLCPYHQCSVIKKKKINPTHWMNSLNENLCPSGQSCLPAQVVFVSRRLPGIVKLKFLFGLIWSTSPRTAERRKKK